METGRKRIRKDFAPLTTSVSLSCLTAYSPVTQVFNAANMTYEPNRLVTPTLLRPDIIANANDGSIADPHANARLANMVWKANGTDISTLPDWSGLYSINQVGYERGTLTIYRNVLPSERISLHFEADLVDNRLGVTVSIKTDPIVLSTVDASEDTYGLSIGETQRIFYNPFLDIQHRIEWKTSHGITPTAAELAAASDGNQYQRTIPIELFKGGTKLTSGYTVKLYRINNVNSLTELSAGAEIVSISTSAIVLDLRMIEKDNFLIKAFSGATELAKIQFSVERVYPAFSCEPTNETGILPTQRERYDVAQVHCEGKIVECPSSIIKITWYTDTATITSQQHNEGAETIFNVPDTGIGSTANDDWMEVWTEAIQKGIYRTAVDANGDTFVDENGNELIFN